jgi:hypothetical protein
VLRERPGPRLTDTLEELDGSVAGNGHERNSAPGRGQAAKVLLGVEHADCASCSQFRILRFAF